MIIKLKLTLTAVALVLTSAAVAVAGEKAIPERVRVVYAIENINADPFPLSAYLVVGDELILAQRSWFPMPPLPAEGPRGITVDSDHARLFIAHEGTNELTTIDSQTFELLDPTPIPEADSPAGMDVDEANDLMYITDGGQMHVVVYDTTDMTHVETWDLPTGGGTMGIAVADGLLYVGDATTTIRYYDLSDKTEAGSFDITDNALAVSAIADPTPLVFSSAVFGNEWLNKYDVSADVETRVQPGIEVRGLKANPDDDVVYALGVNAGESNAGLYVFSVSDLSETAHYSFGDAEYSPTDCALGTRDFGGTVKVEVSSPAGAEVLVESPIAFTITIGNPGEKTVDTLPFLLMFDPETLTFVSSDPAADDAATEGQLAWDDLSASFGEDLDPGAFFTVQATFTAKGSTPCVDAGGQVIGQMEQATDVDGAVVENAAGNASYLIVCETDDDKTPDDDDDDDDGCGCGC